MLRKTFKLSMLFLVAAFHTSCSNDANSNPQFIFKPAPDTKTAAKLGNMVITNEELLKGVEVDIYEAEMKVHEIKMNRLQAVLIEKMIDADPKKGSMTHDEYLNKNIASSITITEKMIDEFAKERNIPAAQINDRMKERIKGFLEMGKKKEAIDQWLAGKVKGKSVEVYLNKPKRPVFNVDASGAPFVGAANAKVTLVEFSDFQCPFCAKGATILNDLKKHYGNKLKIVFKQYPLPFHKDAKLASEAALCVNAQNKDAFWKMHDLMFQDQSKLKLEDLVAKAKQVGVDEKKVKTCLEKSQFKAQVEKDVEQGRNLGVKSTPTFFINGMIVNGAQPIEIFKEMIDKGLAK